MVAQFLKISQVVSWRSVPVEENTLARVIFKALRRMSKNNAHENNEVA